MKREAMKLWCDVFKANALDDDRTSIEVAAKMADKAVGAFYGGRH